MKSIVRCAIAALPGLMLAGATEAATCSSTLFIEAAGYPAGVTARLEAIGDFDGDLLADVAVAGSPPNGVAVLLNDGAGGLNPPILTALGENPTALAAARLRDGGPLDLVVAGYNGVWVLLGHGDGTFDPPVFHSTETYNIYSIVVGTFDGNATTDVVVASYYSSDISLLPGAGDGTFGEPILTATPWTTASMTSGDFNSDGKLDLLTSTASGYVVLYPGSGDGRFGTPVPFLAGVSLAGVVSGDFDGDGHPDVAVGSGGFVSVLLGNGSGGFQAALLYPAHMTLGLLATGDLDQDGFLDIVAAETSDFYNSSDQISVLRGLGDGTFESGKPYSAGGTSGIGIADMNDDGYPDVVSAGGGVFLLLNATDGSLLAVPNSPVGGPISPNYAQGDWNGDGRLDFAWVDNNYQVVLAEGREGGRFERIGALPPPEVNFQPYGVAAGHFFDSEIWDIVVVTYSDVYLYRGFGVGSVFYPPVSIFNSFNLGYVVVSDIDGRNGDDVVVTRGCCGNVEILTLLRQDDGSFQSPVSTPFSADVRYMLSAHMASGFPPPGSAGTRDLVVVTPSDVRVLLGTTGGNFFLRSVTPAGNGAAVAVGFFGGFPNDLLVTDGSPSVRLYTNDGNGHFPDPPVTIALTSSGQSLASGHYDDDNLADFAVLSEGTIFVFLGLGDGEFLAPIVLSTEVNPSFLQTASLSGDLIDDLVALGYGGIAAFRNPRLGGWVRWQSVLNNSTAVFRAHASGYGPLTFQWRKDGVDLVDGGPISGAHTDTLTIDPATFADAGLYDVTLTDSCTVANSDAGALYLEFADVPITSLFHDDIIAIAMAGITGGCGGSDYCPTANVRRDQMAAFLLRAEHGADYLPPPCAGVFSDVPCPGAFTDWIEQLAAEGVTGGCGMGIYCPDQNVTRAQMAVFLLKTKEGSSYTPPPATGIFGDVSVGSFAADFIEDLYVRGITGGCSASPLLYCPGSPVLRQQMATFLVRTFFP